MTDQPASGNRWEPSETQPISAIAAATPAPLPAPVPAPVPAAVPVAGSATARRSLGSRSGWRAWPTSVWTVIVAVGVAAFLASGIVGYAVGTATHGTNQPATSVFGPGQNQDQDQGQNPGFDRRPGADRDGGQGPGSHGFGTQP